MEDDDTINSSGTDYVTPTVSHKVYPIRELTVNYGGYGSFKLTRTGLNQLRFVGRFLDQPPQDQRVYFDVRQIAPGIFMVWWYERATDNMVTQIQNLWSRTVNTNIFDRRSSVLYSLDGDISFDLDTCSRKTQRKTLF